MPTNANVSVADNPSWAAPEIRITTYDGTASSDSAACSRSKRGANCALGRGGPGADLIIEDEHVSRVHMRFFVKDGRRLVEDMGSRWGTRFNGGPLTDPMPLKHGDEIRLGKTTIHYICYWDLLPQNQQAPPVAVRRRLRRGGGTGEWGGADRGGGRRRGAPRPRRRGTFTPPPPTAPPSPATRGRSSRHRQKRTKAKAGRPAEESRCEAAPPKLLGF